MPHLICYDITGDTLRTQLSKKIIASGLDRINKSVYLGTVGESSLTSLVTALQQLMQSKSDPQDSVIILTVSVQQVQSMQILGLNELDRDDLSGEKTTLIV